MQRLSYSTAKSTLESPHTYLCKQMGLKTFTTHYFEEGKAAHKAVQESVSGVYPIEVLAKIPRFEVVETEDFDEKCHGHYKINDSWEIHGYADLLSHEHKRFGDIKSGTPWSLAKAYNHPQFNGYSLMFGYNDFWLICLPRDIDSWNDNNIKIFNFEITKSQQDKALEFFNQAIYTIEHIKEALATEMETKKPGRSPACFYQGCPWCQDDHLSS